MTVICIYMSVSVNKALLEPSHPPSLTQCLGLLLPHLRAQWVRTDHMACKAKCLLSGFLQENFVNTHSQMTAEQNIGLDRGWQRGRCQ